MKNKSPDLMIPPHGASQYPDKFTRWQLFANTVCPLHFTRVPHRPRMFTWYDPDPRAKVFGNRGELHENDIRERADFATESEALVALIEHMEYCVECDVRKLKADAKRTRSEIQEQKQVAEFARIRLKELESRVHKPHKS